MEKPLSSKTFKHIKINSDGYLAPNNSKAYQSLTNLINDIGEQDEEIRKKCSEVLDKDTVFGNKETLPSLETLVQVLVDKIKMEQGIFPLFPEIENIPEEIFDIHKIFRETLDLHPSEPYFIPYYASLILEIKQKLEKKEKIILETRKELNKLLAYKCGEPFSLGGK